MSRGDRTALGDRMKSYEALSPSGGIFMPHLPIVCRMDGRKFSRWTRGLRRPYDGRLSRLMIEVTKLLVKETGARVGYTQSDEITLVLCAEDIDQELYYGSKVGKILSHLGGLAGVFFNRMLPDLIPEKTPRIFEHEHPCPYTAFPHPMHSDFPTPCECGAWIRRNNISHLATFDARAFNVPNLHEAANAVLWREIDATRNSISMAAQHYYSHKQLHQKDKSAKLDMLMEKGVNWNDYPSFFKRGTYCRRIIIDGVKSSVRELSLDPLRRFPHERRLEILFDSISQTQFSATTDEEISD